MLFLGNIADIYLPGSNTIFVLHNWQMFYKKMHLAYSKHKIKLQNLKILKKFPMY